jgi:6-phosphogluconolactonase/glucosamine-6-phosphate isomerase/deaminase
MKLTSSEMVTKILKAGGINIPIITGVTPQNLYELLIKHEKGENENGKSSR